MCQREGCCDEGEDMRLYNVTGGRETKEKGVSPSVGRCGTEGLEGHKRRQGVKVREWAWMGCSLERVRSAPMQGR